jgi:hypothetical protein
MVADAVEACVKYFLPAIKAMAVEMLDAMEAQREERMGLACDDFVRNIGGAAGVDPEPVD